MGTLGDSRVSVSLRKRDMVSLRLERVETCGDLSWRAGWRRRQVAWTQVLLHTVGDIVCDECTVYPGIRYVSRESSCRLYRSLVVSMFVSSMDPQRLGGRGREASRRAPQGKNAVAAWDT